MLKLVGKKIFTILRSKFCLSKPVINNYSRLISPDHHLEDSSFRNSALYNLNTFCQDSSTVLSLYNAMFEVHMNGPCYK